MKEQVQSGDRVGYDAVTGDKIAYQHDGETVQATVTDTYPNAIVFETRDGRSLSATYQQLADHQAIYTYVRPKNALPPAFSLY